MSVLPSLVDALKPSKTDADKMDALAQLAQIVDTSYGEDADVLCEYLRVSGCVKLIAQLLENPEPQIHQTALLLIGNIASEAVDSQAEKTKALLKDHRAFEKMLVRLRSPWSPGSQTSTTARGRSLPRIDARRASLPHADMPSTLASLVYQSSSMR